MAGFRESFGGNVDFAYGQRAMLGRQMDMAGGIERGLAGIGQYSGKVRGARTEIERLNKELESLKTQRWAAVFAGDAQEVARLEAAMKRTTASAKEMREEMGKMPLQALGTGFDKLTKGLLKFNAGLLSIGFDFIIDSIKRVYELQERWAKAIGGFNLQLGGMTKGIGGAMKMATQWSGVIRGLTDGDIAEGIQMFGEFTMTLGQVQKAMDFGKWGLEAARGFNLGGAGAAKLGAALDSMGDSTKDMTKFMGADMAKAADAAGVPINLLAKDISESTTYMARFGKEGQRTFVQGAAFAHKFYMSIKDVQRSVEGLDMFDEAARTASKLNTVFGTMTNSIDLMMEDDPVKRIEMIRQQLLAVGKTEDRLSPKEIRYLSETMHLTEEQTRALLSRQHAGESYEDFQKKAVATEKEEAAAKRRMEQQLRSTAQTLFAFGQAFDRVTMAIAKAIDPILEVFGLGEKSREFGKKMGSTTYVIEQFFLTLAKNDKWKGFMQTLADDLRSAAKALAEFVLSGKAADMVGDLAAQMKKFYTWVRDLVKDAVPYLEPLVKAFMFLAKHIDRIAVAWASMKGVQGLNSIIGGIGGMTGAEKGSFFGKGGAAGRGALGMGLGAATGGLLGGTGAMVGGALGGAIGAFVPIIGPLMGPLGAALGKGIEYLFRDRDPEMEKLQDQLETTIAKRLSLEEKMSAQAAVGAARQKMQALKNKQADDIINGLRKDNHKLSDSEIVILRERIEGLQGFGKQTDLVKGALTDLSKPTGPVVLTAEKLGAVATAADDQAQKFKDLSIATGKYIDQENARLGIDSAKIEVERAQAQKKVWEAQLHDSQRLGDEYWKQYKEKFGKSGRYDLQEMETNLKDRGRIWDKLSPDQRKIYGKIVEQRDLQKELNDKITKGSIVEETKQTKLLEKQLLIQSEQLLTNDEGFKKFAATNKFESTAQALKYFVTSPEGRAASDELLISKDDLVKIAGGTTAERATKMAGGGIVSRPMHALIGESGPEAVVPLRAMARGRMRQPDKFGGSAAQGLVGYGGSSGVRVVSSVADVHLDGQKVGRAVVRTLVTGRD